MIFDPSHALGQKFLTYSRSSLELPTGGNTEPGIVGEPESVTGLIFEFRLDTIFFGDGIDLNVPFVILDREITDKGVSFSAIEHKSDLVTFYLHHLEEDRWSLTFLRADNMGTVWLLKKL